MIFRAFHIFPLLTFVILLVTHSLLYGQTEIVPVHYLQYFNNPGFINPAISNPSGKFECFINSRTQLGIFNNVRSTFLQGTLVIRKKESKPNGMTGVIVQNESEGKYLDRTRVYGIYILRTNISSSLTLNAGAALGIFGYSVSSSANSAGGSATTIDGKFGTLVSSDKWAMGISMHQLFNNTVVPFDVPIRLKRYYSLYGKSAHSIYQKDLNFYCNVDYFRSINASLNFTLGLIEHLEIGGGYRWMEGVSLFGGLRKIEVGKKYMKIGFSYWIPMHNRLSANRSAEFSLVLY